MKKTALTLAVVGGLLLASCAKNKTADLTLNISGLEDLGSEYVYEGWIIVEETPVTTGTFTVDASGNMSSNTFEVNKKDLKDATAFVLTIEPANDSDPAPSDVHILAGDFSDSEASLSVSHQSALGTDFTSATGTFVLATPTDGNTDDETSGVWFMDPGTGGAGLSLPTLPAGWKYEGWVVISGTPLTTGTFTDPTVADDSAPYSGTTAGPALPGEDYIMNAPAGLTFPTDLSGTTVVISVEPSPDNSTNPFTLKPLVFDIPAAATSGTAYTMTNNASATNPSGTATR